MHPPKKVDPSRANRGTRRPTAHRKPSYRPAPPAEPLTDDERDGLTKLREKDYLHSLGDRPSSMAAADIRRMMELESKPAEPKCERCNHPAHWNRCDCGCYYRPPTPEPAESEGKSDLIAAVDNFIAVNAEMWQGQDPDEYMNEIRERPTAPAAESVEDRAKALEEARKFLREQGFPGNTDIIPKWLEQYATKQIERQTPAIIERFKLETGCKCGKMETVEQGATNAEPDLTKSNN